MEIVFATNNPHKIEEIQNIAGNNINIVSLADIGCFDDIPEEQLTIEGNASQKAWYIFNKYGKNCFADDTGLEVHSLNNEPGVFSARYAGAEKNSESNMNKLLDKLKDKKNRSARFKTCISIIINGKEKLFEGIINGSITKDKNGEKGFGYDPIFLPKGYNISFAEMDISEKNKISHRGIAVTKLIDFLKNQII